MKAKTLFKLLVTGAVGFGTFWMLTSRRSADSVKVSIIEAINAVYKAGYKGISLIKFKGDYYFISAINEAKDKVELHINTATGELTEG